MKRFFCAFLLITLLATVSINILMPSVKAFSNNNMIDDSVFDNYNSMSADQIDAWLNNFPSSCISTNSGFSASEPIGYTPLSSNYNGRYSYSWPVSAGRVIYDLAQAHQINPQVLLVKLENEEGLVRGDGPYGCGATAMASAVGYACTDSGTFTNNYSYTASDPYTDSSGLSTPLYFRNGNPSNSITGSCVNTNIYTGFTEQLAFASWFLSWARHKSEGQTGWAAINGNYNHCDDNNTCPANMNIPANWACYSHLMTQGTYKRCPTGTSAFYDGYATIDGQSIHLDNGSTAALYVYTPHFQSFDNIFVSWFGSPNTRPAGIRPSNQSLYSQTACNIPSFDSTKVGRLYQPDTQDFLYTTNFIEACAAIRYGYIWDGIVMANVDSSDPNAIPVYRIANLYNHLFTSSLSVKNNYMDLYGYHDEGIGWYAYGSSVSNSIPVTELTNGTGTFFFTSATAESTYYQDNYSYSSFGTAFFTPALAGSAGSVNVYRLSTNGGQRLYTADQTEHDAVINSYGYKDEGVVSMGDNFANQNNTPVYRLRSSFGGYFYTINRTERDLAVINYNYLSEGIGFYDLRYSGKPIYRIKDSRTGLRVFTNSLVERNQAISRYGYVDEGVGWYGY